MNLVTICIGNENETYTFDANDIIATRVRDRYFIDLIFSDGSCIPIYIQTNSMDATNDIDRQIWQKIQDAKEEIDA